MADPTGAADATNGLLYHLEGKTTEAYIAYGSIAVPGAFDKIGKILPMQQAKAMIGMVPPAGGADELAGLGGAALSKVDGALLDGADELVDAVPEGVVYKRTDLNGNLEPYGGQAKDVQRFIDRQAEHARKHPESDFDFEIVDRADPGEALYVAEHNFIQELTGGIDAKQSPLVSNMKNPVGPKRRPRLGLPEPMDY